ncbi:hypothetical protein KDW_04600 [Dictyobacter vulcani]|uniref:Short-chain dehydrogenase n=1 Tax=Dictyobacter vulcani TaxID=2607529 RepID=A0A5J4KC58_9CHLR|nr:hypothetical protein [Dictyobacter vulcani]GER86298.1 hypothetical protein KDW_04600 [Dictyobacter vulcani]
MGRLDGKIAIVTGAGRGVGRAIADVTDPQACEQVVDQTIQRFGQIDILVIVNWAKLLQNFG